MSKKTNNPKQRKWKVLVDKLEYKVNKKDV